MNDRGRLPLVRIAADVQADIGKGRGLCGCRDGRQQDEREGEHEGERCNAMFPMHDLFALSRPADIPEESLVTEKALGDGDGVVLKPEIFQVLQGLRV